VCNLSHLGAEIRELWFESSWGKKVSETISKNKSFLYSYLKQTKMSFFKIKEQKGKTGPVWSLAPVGGGD
jgi:hypothetical protein